MGRFNNKFRNNTGNVSVEMIQILVYIRMYLTELENGQ